MLTKRETDYKIYYSEEAEQLTPSIGDLIIYNLRRVGCMKVKETLSYTKDDTDSYTFNYKGKSYEGDLCIGKWLAIGDNFIVNTEYTDEGKNTSFEVRLDLPPIIKAALTAISTEELTEALASKKDWIRKAAQKRFEVLRAKETEK